MAAYYNEIEPYAAQWLRNLIAAGLIPEGDVDERSIVDVRPDDLRAYSQCHFFAGIGGWAYALRLARWPDDRPVWTGSCPCQPLSVAGKRAGHVDERHLWPTFHRLIAECKPATVFGEQVASKDGREWLAAVRADLEGDGYAVGCADLCAAGVGAPHIRQRLWFVANTNEGGRERAELHLSGQRSQQAVPDTAGASSTFELADAMQPAGERRAGSILGAQASGGRTREFDGDCAVGLADGGEALRGLAYPASEQVGLPGQSRPLGDADNTRSQARKQAEETRRAGRTSFAGSPWRDLVWLPCTDGKARPTKPGIFPLAHGVSARVGKLRAAGNAIVPQVAAEFIRAAMEAA